MCRECVAVKVNADEGARSDTVDFATAKEDTPEAEALIVVPFPVLVRAVMLHAVATPLASSWHVIGMFLLGQLRFVMDWRKRLARKVKRLFPTVSSGVAAAVNWD